MILDNMTSEELAKEVLRDYPVVLRKSKYLVQSCRRNAVKSSGKHYRKFFDYHTKQNNDWLILVDYYVSDPLLLIVVYYKDRKGLNAILIDANQKSLMHYSDHFLKRYNERYLKLANPSKIELLKKYITENAVYHLEKVPDDEHYMNRIFGRTRHGVVLGYSEYFPNNEIHFFKTFISKDLIHEGQELSFNLNSNYYKRLWDETFGKTKRGAF